MKNSIKIAGLIACAALVQSCGGGKPAKCTDEQMQGISGLMVQAPMDNQNSDANEVIVSKSEATTGFTNKFGASGSCSTDNGVVSWSQNGDAVKLSFKADKNAQAENPGEVDDVEPAADANIPANDNPGEIILGDGDAAPEAVDAN